MNTVVSGNRKLDNLNVLAFTLALLLICFGDAFAQDSLNVERVSTIVETWGEVESSDYSEEYGVLVTPSSSSQVISWSDAEEVQSQWHDFGGWDVHVQGDLIYRVPGGYTGSDFFIVQQIHDLSTVTEVFRYEDNSRFCWLNRMQLYDDYLLYEFIAELDSEIMLFSLENPREPALLSIIEQDLLESTLLIDDYIYAQLMDSTVAIWNIQNPSNPVLETILDLTEYPPFRMFWEEGLCIVSGRGSFYFLDVSNPANPQISYMFEDESFLGAGDIAILDNYMFLARAYQGYTIVDIQDIENPVVVDVNEDFQFSVAVRAGERIFANSLESSSLNNSLGVFELEGNSLIRTHDQEFINGINGSAINDSLLVININGSEYRTRIVDISHPYSPSVLSEFTLETLDNRPTHLDIYGETGVLTENLVGIHLLNLEDPENPDEFAFIDVLFTSYRPPIIYQNALYILRSWENALWVWDITNPESPEHVSTLSGIGNPREWNIDNNRIWISTPFEYDVVNVEDPLHPYIEFETDEILYGSSFQVNDGRLLTAIQYEGFYYYDISSPDQPVLLGCYETEVRAPEIFSLHPDHAVFTSYTMTFGVLNLQNPGDIHLYGYYADSSSYLIQSLSVNPSGDLVFAPTHDNNAWDLFHIDLSMMSAGESSTTPVPECFTLSAWPNPFNPTTNIRVGLSQSGTLQLSVYNILGEKVMDLAHGYYQAGEHQFRFNGSRMASGVYLLQLESDAGSNETLRLHLVK